MKIYAVEKDCEYPFIGFKSRAAAKNYILKEYTNDYVAKMLDGGNEKETLRQIYADLNYLCDHDSIEDYFYIHEVEVMDE